MQDFKNQKATLLLCTPEAERGLDMPGVDYVYSLDAPSTTASYLHRAGRCGRLGATTTGVVTSVVTPEEESVLDQSFLDLEISNWEKLEERVNAPSVAALAADAKKTVFESESDDARSEPVERERAETIDADAWKYAPDDRYESENPVEEEERSLTAAALNDLFYLVDAQAEAVNALEDMFAEQKTRDASYTASWDAMEEDDPEDVANEKRMDEIRKLFEIVDERDLDEDGNEK
jgi:superfamily II DNA/RNA helicase